MSISRGVLTSHVSLAFQQGTDFALAYATRRNSLDHSHGSKEGVKSHCHHMTGIAIQLCQLCRRSPGYVLTDGQVLDCWILLVYWNSTISTWWCRNGLAFPLLQWALVTRSSWAWTVLKVMTSMISRFELLWLKEAKSQNISKQQALHEMEEPPPLLYRVSHDLQDIFELTLGEQLDLIDLIVINQTKQDQWIRKVMPKRTVAPGEKKLGCWMVWHSALQTYGCGWK